MGIRGEENVWKIGGKMEHYKNQERVDSKFSWENTKLRSGRSFAAFLHPNHDVRVDRSQRHGGVEKSLAPQTASDSTLNSRVANCKQFLDLLVGMNKFKN